MATFGAVATAIARRLIDDNNTAVTLIEIREAINEAISYWKHRRFWFNTARYQGIIAAADTTSNDATSTCSIVTTPSDFLTDLPRNGLVVIDNLFPYQVKKNDPSMFDGIASLITTGRPRIYTNRNGVIESYPSANKAYNYNLYYIKDYPALLTDGTNDTSTNDFLADDKGRFLIQNHALANLHGELRQDDLMEKRYTERRDAEYNTMIARTQKILRTGILTVEQ